MLEGIYLFNSIEIARERYRDFEMVEKVVGVQPHAINNAKCAIKSFENKL